ncbi:ankyrin repeat domain-containing protein 27-like [Littorina saxatilis]|uniref:VPS9 domain-containing protein n=1 Tax=Littorina saxatilis TaxID=31220 RepID=A0AAN9AJM7_9CAEN
MACDVDELDINPFFRALQNKFSDLYNRAQEKCYTICIPQTTSILGTDINKDFAETHILKPSPYFQGQLLTLTSHGNHSKTVTLANDGCSISTGEGFPSKVIARIVNEELAYNKEYDQYRVLILDQPLDPKFQPQTSEDDSSKHKLPEQCVSAKECKKFLQSVPEFAKVLERVEDQLKLFNSNYMVLPDYLMEAASRLADISAEAVEGCLKAAGRTYAADFKWRDTVVAALESYVMSAVHDKVFGVVVQQHKAEDESLELKCQRQLRGINVEALGIQHRFACPLPNAELELSRMDWLTTPREKLFCLKAVMDAVTSEITAHLSRNIPPHLALTADKPCLTSDDLIPILVNVIGQSECEHLHSDIIYMETFAWASCAKDLDDLSYCLVTFKAAVQYIQATDFSKLAHKHRKQVSLDKLSSATDRLSIYNGSVMGDNSPSPRISPTPFSPTTSTTTPTSATASGTDRLGRQMSRVSKALKEPPQGHGKDEQKVKSIFGAEYDVPVALEAASKSNAGPDLGDFLSSLQDDFVSYGKQN